MASPDGVPAVIRASMATAVEFVSPPPAASLTPWKSHEPSLSWTAFSSLTAAAGTGWPASPDATRARIASDWVYVSPSP